MEYLDSVKLKGDSTDKIIDGGICGKERPDRIFDNGEFIIILECDENQHMDRVCECEQTRMINIGQMFGGAPVYFIRFNPDSYSSNDNMDVELIKTRHKLVGEIIRDMIKKRIEFPKALVSVLYLYYDGWTSIEDAEWKILTHFDNIISHT